MTNRKTQYRYFLRYRDELHEQYSVVRYPYRNGKLVQKSIKKRALPSDFNRHIGLDTYDYLEFLYNATDEELDLYLLSKKLDDSPKKYAVWRSDIFR